MNLSSDQMKALLKEVPAQIEWAKKYAPKCLSIFEVFGLVLEDAIDARREERERCAWIVESHANRFDSQILRELVPMVRYGAEKVSVK